MKYLMVLIITVLSACGKQGAAGASGVSIIGPRGPQGASGTGLVSTTVPALPSQCPFGGNVVLIAQDTAGTGVWEPSDTYSSTLVACNGYTPQGNTSFTLPPVQLCPNNAATNYSTSTFSEVAFCIDNNLYAVYSANGGFLTEVQPGTWSSDGINSSCTFTVGTNCSVTQN